MFIGVMSGEGRRSKASVVCVGPAASFGEVASEVRGSRCALVIEFSSVHGWLSVWERVGERFECIAEAPAADVLRGEVALPC
jgi:hypothetical protein